MRREPGVYALMMFLQEPIKGLRIGSLGTFDFDAGYYIYVGSACGGGGLQARTDRHRCSDPDKKQKWNVDYLRVHARISEIWFSHTRSLEEPFWAITVHRMTGAQIPAGSFGAADWKRLSRSHLYYFPTRPFLAQFRSDYYRKIRSRPPIYTEFVEPFASDPLSILEPPLSTLESYDRGRRFLEIRRRAQYDGLPGADDDRSLTSIRKGSVGRRLLQQTSVLLNVPEEQLREDVRFAEGVETIVQNDRDGVAFPVLFDPKSPQSREAILRLSRTADTRQAYRIQGVAEGRFRSIAPQNDDAVFDTVAFGEVPRRLARARGVLQQLGTLFESTTEPAIIKECLHLLKVGRRAVSTLRKFLTLEIVCEQNIPQSLRKSTVFSRLMARSVQGKVVGQARLALRMTIKNVWDYPEMQRRGIYPTQDEREQVHRELKQILVLINTILATENSP